MIMRKQVPLDASVDEKARTARFVITSDRVDRDNDVILPSAWEVGNFLATGGPVLFNHQHDELPVARTIDLQRDGSRWVATAQFPPVGTYDFADTVFNLVKLGFLRSASVGFKPLESHLNGAGGTTYTRLELIEWSITGTPANVDAVLASVKSPSPREAMALKAWCTGRTSKDGRVLSGRTREALRMILDLLEGGAHAAAAQRLAALLDVPAPHEEPADESGIKLLPEPLAGESQEVFMGRCMVDPVMVEEFPEEAQRLAVCSRQWVESQSAVLDVDDSEPLAFTDGDLVAVLCDVVAETIGEVIGEATVATQAALNRARGRLPD